MITYIAVKDLYPHPDNPRKDLGDLTELAASIQASGILQNLTVVPHMPGYCASCDTYNAVVCKCKEGHDADQKLPCSKWASKGTYTVVIGHRRLSAAKQAGLTEVPCVIAEMDQKTQVATMLLENMQRSDLTVYEQAQGFQMMIDLGETVNGIAEKTGFSETTVRKRVKLLELDQDKFKQAQERGATLMDYAKLNGIENLKERNKVLNTIGTSNFNWELRNALSAQNAKINRPLVKKELDSFATKIDIKSTGKYEYVKHINLANWKEGEVPKDAGKKQYFYVLSDNAASLYREKAKAEKKKVSPAEKAFRELESQLKELTARAYESRYDFVKTFCAGKKYTKEILTFAMRKLLNYGRAELNDLLKILDIEAPERDGGSMSDYLEEERSKRGIIMEKYVEQPERVLLMAAYLGFSDSKNKAYYEVRSWQNKIEYRKNEDLDYIYDTLMSIGYPMSDEEQALRDGTHELFVREE